MLGKVLSEGYKGSDAASVPRPYIVIPLLVPAWDKKTGIKFILLLDHFTQSQQ
jgi:hypothetical protein